LVVDDCTTSVARGSLLGVVFLKGLLGTCAACVAKAGGSAGGSSGSASSAGSAGGSAGGGGGGGPAPQTGAPPPPLRAQPTM